LWNRRSKRTPREQPDIFKSKTKNSQSKAVPSDLPCQAGCCIIRGMGMKMRLLLATTLGLLGGPYAHAQPLAWPSDTPTTIKGCPGDVGTENDSRVPVSLIVVASVQSESYKERQSSILAIYEDCPDSRRSGVKAVTNSWGHFRRQLEIIQILRGGPVREPLYTFSATSEWGPPSDTTTQRWISSDTETARQSDLTKPLLFCLRWNSGVYWTAHVYSLLSDVAGAFVLPYEELARAKLSAHAHSVSVVDRGLVVAVRGALLQELDLTGLCS
jgi:hypothetical protein